jgi:hypothetical protein
MLCRLRCSQRRLAVRVENVCFIVPYKLWSMKTFPCQIKDNMALGLPSKSYEHFGGYSELQLHFLT